MTKAKEARYCAVNLEVWVRKPGPMAEVAIKNAAPSKTDRFFVPSFVPMIRFLSVSFKI
jgi:hypothetical protein